MKNSTFITRVVLKNYKSIAACDVQLQPLTFLVGRNGSGKSNFLDALRFVADALNFSLDHALRDRGGINDVRRRSRGHPNHFSIGFEFTLPNELIEQARQADSFDKCYRDIVRLLGELQDRTEV